VLSCSLCLLLGITVPVTPDSKTKIRVFPIRRDDHQPKLRTNFTYDIKMAIPERFKPTEKNDRRDYMNGYLGRCNLRDLRHFDVGRCFVFDTLHNLYRGTFVSALFSMFFERNSCSFFQRQLPHIFFLLSHALPFL
jgi:hypothetical protein